MSREEDVLREACAQLAQEETDQWERSLSRADLRQAEEAYRRHRRRALSLIRHSARGGRRDYPWLRAAAIAVILAGAVYFTLSKPPDETVPQGQPAAFTVVPYYSPVPSPSAEAETIWESFTTSPEITADNSTFIPTYTPYKAETPLVSSTPSPTPTPAPTAAPSPGPAAAEPAIPGEWTGSYFPMGLLAVDADPAVTRGEGWQQISWAGWTFTEYADSRVLNAPADAVLSYVQWEDTVALRMETARGVTLAWVRDGRSLCLHAGEGDALDMAETVKKISGE